LFTVISVNNKAIKQMHALIEATASHLQTVADHQTLPEEVEEEEAEVVKAELHSKELAETVANKVIQRAAVGRKKIMQA
jgi:hypothetical protein